MARCKGEKIRLHVDYETLVIEHGALQHDYMKCKSNADLIEAYNKDGIKRKLRAKVRVEIDRRNKLGLSNIIFTDKPIEND